MNTTDVINGIADRAKLNNPPKPEDYIGNDGLLRCGVCHEPKECPIDVDGKTLIVRCLCRCGVEARKKAAEEEQRRHTEERRSEWLKGYEGMTFANSTGNPTMATAERMVDRWDGILENRVSFTLSGGVGCGKTYAAASVANEILSRGYRVWMVSTSELLNRLFSSPDVVTNRLETFELVVLDDFGAERDTEYAAEKMFWVIDTRMRTGLPTIITTNLDINAAAPSLTYERIFSRLRGDAPQYRCRGEDMRSGRGNEKRKIANEILKGSNNHER